MARPLQLATVVVALVFVLSAAGYGIVRGFQTNSHHAPIGCRPTVGWLPVINAVTLPRELPEGVRLANACYSTGSVTLFYGNGEQDKALLVIMLEDSVQHASVPSGMPIQLGDIVGYSRDETSSDGVRNYSIFFNKRGWLYGVSANLGKNPGLPDNTVTPDEVNAVALNMAQR